jgi:hypothetical protein
MAYDVAIDGSVEGKRVVNEDGEEIGVVTAVRDGTAYVDPDPGLTEKLTSKLGWADVDEDDYPLPEGSIERITDDEVHIRREI